jgi:phospholipid/cholesterol/gamma-HCH transport system substrate-binding protein
MAKLKPEERAFARSVVAGCVVLIGIILVMVLTGKVPTGLPFLPTTTVRAEFHDIHSLQVNAEVRRNSQYIGRVSGIQVDGDRALITMQLDGHQTVYRDAHARIWDVSALATKFVELDFGTPASGSLGSRVLPAARDEDSADLDQLLNVFDPQTRVAVQSTLRQIGGGAVGHSDDLHAYLDTAYRTLPEAGTVAEDLASGEFNLPALIHSADTLTSRFLGRTQEISQLVTQSDATFRALMVDGGNPLRDTLASAPSTLAQVRPALDSLDGPLSDAAAATRDFAPGAEGLGSATPDLRGFLREVPTALNGVPDVAHDAKPAVEELTNTMSDARPFAPRVRLGLESLDPPLEVVSQYGGDIANWILRGRSFVSQGPEPAKRFARLIITPGIEGLTVARDSYPKPGEASRDRFGARTLLKGIGK